MTDRYEAIFVSPHIDDVVFSCGGTLAQACQRGRVLVVSVFSHSGKTTTVRKKEEEATARLLGYEPMFLDFPDNIRRDWLGGLSFRMFRKEIPKKEKGWCLRLAEKFENITSERSAPRFYFPLGVGGHVDHLICHQLGASSSNAFFFEDLPYAFRFGQLEKRLGSRFPPLTSTSSEIDEVFGLKMKAIWHYVSQAPRFFRNRQEGERLYRSFHTVPSSGKLCERLWTTSPIQ